MKNTSRKARKAVGANGAKSGQTVLEFTVDPCQGMAALLAGSMAEGKPLTRMERKGGKATAYYGDPS